MACEHDKYREVVSRYDRAEGLLTYYWRCETCGVLLDEASRLRYRPRFAPLPQVSYLPRSPSPTARAGRARAVLERAQPATPPI
jgi:hypothetical protein